VSDALQTRWIVRHREFAAALMSWLLLILLEATRFVQPDASEFLRLVLAIATVTLLFFQWQRYRRCDTGLHLAFLTFAVLAFCIPAIWLGLNVIRYWLYDPENHHPRMDWVWSRVVSAQDILFWIGTALVALTAILGMLDFLRFATHRAAR
jgi:amino acid transporter